MFEINPGLAIWTVITFIVLLLVLKRFAWKPLLQALEKREENIRKSIEDAEKAKTEAEEQLEKYNKIIDKAKSESNKILQEGKERAEVLKNEVIADAKKEANQLIENAKKEIELQKDKAVEDLKIQAANLSVLAASKFISSKITQQEQDNIIGEAIKELGEIQ